jgi:hypothetical protein
MSLMPDILPDTYGQQDLTYPTRAGNLLRMTDPADIQEPNTCPFCGGWDTNRAEDHANGCPLGAEPPDDLDDYRGADQ